VAYIGLSEEMYRYGYTNISNIDISRVVIEKMRNHYCKNEHSGLSEEKKKNVKGDF
jgi:hypothetical protein